jgi:hypothetical protein
MTEWRQDRQDKNNIPPPDIWSLGHKKTQMQLEDNCTHVTNACCHIWTLYNQYLQLIYITYTCVCPSCNDMHSTQHAARNQRLTTLTPITWSTHCTNTASYSGFGNCFNWSCRRNTWKLLWNTVALLGMGRY